MLPRRLLLLALVAASSVPLAAAGQRSAELQPAESALGTFDFHAAYLMGIRATLLAGATDSPYLRMVCLPSFSVEWAISVGTPEAREARVEYRVVNEKIWQHENPQAIRTTVHEATISRETAELLHRAWHGMLRRTRYPPPSDTIGLDGTSYDFTSFQRGTGQMEGTTWSPSEVSRTGQLVALGDALRELALSAPSERPAMEQAILQRAQALLDDLQRLE
jgi:hypothetical protein